MPQPPFTIVAGALQPVLPFAFVDGLGAPLDLTGVTVTVTITPVQGGTPVQDHASCTVNTPATLGTGYYAWQTGDTVTPGRYFYQWTATKSTVPMGLPTDSNGFISITPSLG